ncbi:crossover junction endodeoxyribonuclease RuvC [Pseudomonas paraeruginosa]
MGVDVIGDPVFLDLPLDQRLALAQLRRAAALQLAEQALPVWTHAALAIKQFVVGRVA